MDEITGLSILILLAVLMLPVIASLLSKHPKLLRSAKYLALLCYVAANLYLTIFSREVRRNPWAKYELFWSYRRSLSYSGTWRDLLTGNWGKLKITNYILLKQIILNILLYIPMGYLLPFTWPRLCERRNSKFTFLKVTLIGAMFSAATELSQLYFHLGTFEYDDMVNNTLGCILGCMLYRWIVWKRKRKADAGEQDGA